MADASRFPHLALPFAIVGATAGWLSAGLVQHPVMASSSAGGRLVTTAVAAVLGAVTGALIRHWCAPKRYHWEVDDEREPDARLPSDSWLRHAPVLLFAGAVTGAVFAFESRLCEVEAGFLGGYLCTVPFLPVCAAVLAAARRAQRARLGSLVAASDRRAVWGILATALLLATLEALPDWPAPRGKPLIGPAPALALVVAAVACILVVLAADVLAWRRAARVLAQGLTPREAGDLGPDDGAAPHLDLGLGDDLHARVSRSRAAYRGRDRTLAVVQGDGDRARDALRRALRRGLVGVAVAGAVCAAHAAASTDEALARYEVARCARGMGESCGMAADYGLSEPRFGQAASPEQSLLLYEQGCNRADGASCMSLAWLYRGHAGIERDSALVAFFEYRAAQRGVCPEGTRLVLGTENVCVDPLDPRQ
jgi:hypothetical protein